MSLCSTKLSINHAMRDSDLLVQKDGVKPTTQYSLAREHRYKFVTGTGTSRNLIPDPYDGIHSTQSCKGKGVHHLVLDRFG